MSQRHLGGRLESVPSVYLSPPLSRVTHSFIWSGLWRPRGSGGVGRPPHHPATIHCSCSLSTYCAESCAGTKFLPPCNPTPLE